MANYVRIYTDSYLFQYYTHTTHIQSLKYSTYSYITIRMMLSTTTLHKSAFKRITKWVRSDTTTRILSRRLCVCFACCLCLSFFYFVNATTTKAVNTGEWFESLESFIIIVLNLWIWMSRRMNRTYFECHEFDVNVVLKLIATCTYKSMLNWVRLNQSSWISILRHTQNFMSTCEYRKNDLLLISARSLYTPRLFRDAMGIHQFWLLTKHFIRTVFVISSCCLIPNPSFWKHIEYMTTNWTDVASTGSAK